MNRFRIRLAPLTALGGALVFVFACVTAPAKDTAPAATHVTWSDPATLSEVRENTCRGSVKPEEWLGELARYLQRRAAKVLAPGQRLDVTITDIRRAGICEPWRGPRWDDVRIVKDLYAPRIDLRFELADSDGRRISEGERKLRDAAFLRRAVPLPADDPLRYEKRMLDDWLQREFGKHGKTGR